MSSTPGLGPPPERITVEVEQVRRLVADQFPQWADLPVRPVADGGWDNWTFHLGDGMSARLPSASEYALAVDKEHRWLPVLAARLPLPIPVPLAKGRPGPDIDTTDGPRPGVHNWFRGGPLRTYDEPAQRALARLDGHLDVDLARVIWKTALGARWDGVDHWFHGDVAKGNILLRNGKLAAVIDFGTCGVGDPACDLAIAWTLLTADGRRAFRERLSVDDTTWARGRGWALWKTLVACAQALGHTDDAAADAQRALDEIFSECSTSS